MRLICGRTIIPLNRGFPVFGPDSVNRGANAVSRAWFVFRLVLNHLDRMAERRIQT
jgi:hypothetical protein